MAHTDFPQQNQVLFNLSVPLKAKNLVIHPHRPQPVVIERYGDRRETFSGPPNVLPQSNLPFQFKAVSEDRIAMAVQMAKRDLKNKKLQSKSSRSRSPSPKSSKTRVIHSKDYMDRQRKWQKAPKKPLPGRGLDQNRYARSMKTQTPTQSPKPFLNTHVHSRLPATTNSPPTRDTDLYPRHKVREDLQPADNIDKLQLEMEGYLEQIKALEERALDDPDLFTHQSRSRKKDGYLDEEEDENRRVVRSEEFAVRMTRNLYNLRQQVRQIQRELLSTGVDSKIKQTKKSEAMVRLGAAHRGAARAIQAFVTNLPHQDLRSGLPSSFSELSILIRQLTQLSSHVKKGQDSQVQKELTNMLDRVDDLNIAWEKAIRQRRSQNRESPPRKRSPVSRPLFDREEEVLSKQSRLQPKLQGKENKPKGVLKKTVKTRPPQKQKQSKAEHSPERQAALRAGLAALMRDRDPSGERRSRAGVSWNIQIEDKPLERKGLLLPQHLQMKREKLHKTHPQPATDSHFADPTIAANLKAVLPLSNAVLDGSRPNSAPSSPDAARYRSRSHSPSRLGSRHPWRPPGTPTKSPQSPKHRSRSFSPAGSRMRFFVEDVDKDIVKTLFPDEAEHLKVHRQSRKSRSVPSPRRRRSPSSSREREPPRNSFVSSVVEEAKRRMKPFLKKGSASYPGHRASRRSTPSPDRTSSVGDESVSSQLLDNILTETVEDLQDMEHQEGVLRTAMSMKNAPTLEGIFHRLEEMEDEQMMIRQRWASVSYADPKPVSRFFTTKEMLTDRPRSPPGIEITRNDRAGSAPRHVKFSHPSEGEKIIFTKDRKTRKSSQNHFQSESEVPRFPSQSRPRTLLSIPQSVVNRITDSQETYSSHLKKMSHHPQGMFQPWTLIEQISDEIFDECMEEVILELDDMNEAIANHLYKSEFMEAQSRSESPGGKSSASAADASRASPDHSIPQSLRSSRGSPQHQPETLKFEGHHPSKSAGESARYNLESRFEERHQRKSAAESRFEEHHQRKSYRSSGESRLAGTSPRHHPDSRFEEQHHSEDSYEGSPRHPALDSYRSNDVEHLSPVDSFRSDSHQDEWQTEEEEEETP